MASTGIWPDLAGQSRRNLAAHGIGNVVVLVGDGSRAWVPQLIGFPGPRSGVKVQVGSVPGAENRQNA